MLKRKEIWLGDEERQRQIAESETGVDSAFFGFQRVRAADKAEKVLAHFNSVARNYDFMNTLLSLGIHHFWKRVAVRMMQLDPGNRVLDVCGGTGDLALLAARRIGRSGRVIIFDINRTMIQAGLHKVVNADFKPRIQYVQGDAENISFPGNHFDAAMVGFGIRNVTHPRRGFAEMHRVLKPGGTMMCLEFSKPTSPLIRFLYDIYSFRIMPLLGQLFAGSSQPYSHLPESIRMWPLPDELAEILKAVGFEHVSHRRLTNGIAVIHLAVKQRAVKIQ